MSYKWITVLSALFMVVAALAMVAPPTALPFDEECDADCVCDVSNVTSHEELNTHGYTVLFNVTFSEMSDGCCQWGTACQDPAPCTYDYDNNQKVAVWVVTPVPAGAPNILDYNYKTGNTSWSGWLTGTRAEFHGSPDPTYVSCNDNYELFEVHFGDGTVPRVKVKYKGHCDDCSVKDPV